MDKRSLRRTDHEFTEMYERNIDTVYRLCYVLLKNTVDADDAVQSVFLKLYHYGGAFHDREHEKAWLIVTARNTCKDVLKSWWRSRRVDMDVLPEKTYWHNDENQGDVLEKLLRLPEKYKTVLYLYYMEGYSIREMSQILDRKESTLQTQLAKGRERLRMDIGGMYGDGKSSPGAIQSTGAPKST
ncbi:RNA polymerase sigma factor [Paenibacillus nanensis]|uniref:RNA polymerase sigma factor n=1 Tax=Paenibacillus nanensis TaxID=393251 RepID=A0A3A1UUA5_9BACL|nr:RNA polymerase sigma factor [Paenibacillus nanensis]RIX52118.1 RNA polymerase sigma factor [Paenibacillus nanensis]